MVQVRHLTTMQDELAVNYCQLAVVSTDPPDVTAAFRAGLGATFTIRLPATNRQPVRPKFWPTRRSVGGTRGISFHPNNACHYFTQPPCRYRHVCHCAVRAWHRL